MKKISIGVTMKYTENNRIFLTNGNNQNADLLYDLLVKTQKYDVFKVCLDREYNDNPGAKKSFLSMNTAIETLDILLCPVWSLSGKLYEKATEHDIRLVDVSYGNLYASLAHDLISDKPSVRDKKHFQSLYIRNNPLKKARWVSPHYEEQAQFYAVEVGIELEKIKIIPYLWKPKYLNMFLKDRIENVRYENHANKKSLAVYEPNINHTKTMVCPAYTILDYHKRVGFEKDQKIYMYGMPAHGGQKINNFFGGFPRDLIGNFEIKYRKPINEILENSATILSHQLGNSLNYTTLEALYLGLPIVHNSDHIMAGYRYEGYNVIDASKLLEQAFNHQDSDLVVYREAADEEIWKYSPDNEKNISTYIKLIEELMDT